MDGFTFQELKGKILLIVILIMIGGALISGDFEAVIGLIGLLIVGVIAYQIIGWTFYYLSGGKLDFFNMEKQKGTRSKRNKNNSDLNDKHKNTNLDTNEKVQNSHSKDKISQLAQNIIEKAKEDSNFIIKHSSKLPSYLDNEKGLEKEVYLELLLFYIYAMKIKSPTLQDKKLSYLKNQVIEKDEKFDKKYLLKQYKERASEYKKYNKFFSEQPKDTLLWGFEKKIAIITTGKNNIFVMQIIQEKIVDTLTSFN